jgi:hypothetical protein
MASDERPDTAVVWTSPQLGFWSLVGVRFLSDVTDTWLDVSWVGHGAEA